MKRYKRARYLIVGDKGISVEFGNSLDEDINRLVHKMNYAMEKANIFGVIECNPTIRSLFIYYDPLKVELKELLKELKKVEEKMADINLPESRLFEIPIVYGGEYGPDLNLVAELLNLSPEDVIKIHSGREYFIYDTGFIGGSAHFKIPPPLDKLPRKNTPNLGVPMGAVLIAGGLGSVFKPLPGPTGWYWIGMSPLRQWYPENDPPLLILPGDRIIYRPINENEYKEIKKLVDQGIYKPKILKKERM